MHELGTNVNWFSKMLEHQTSSAQKGTSGCFVAVVGPSGAGKDSLIRAMRARFSDEARIVFARRIITRPPDNSEDNETVSPDDFADLAARGAFFLSWSANGLSYGLPAALKDELASGKIVIANISREVVPGLGLITPNFRVVHITAQADILAQRLRTRAREDACARDARLERSSAIDALFEADVVIDNSGDLTQTEKVFEQVLRSLIFPIPLGY